LAPLERHSAQQRPAELWAVPAAKPGPSVALRLPEAALSVVRRDASAVLSLCCRQQEVASAVQSAFAEPAQA
jgi:hypothetical protein